MSKNLIKINGVYNNLAGSENFNIFCTMTIDPNKNLINIKNCEVDQNNNKNLINFNEEDIYLFQDIKFKYYDDIIYNNINLIYDIIYNDNNFEGYYDYFLKNLIEFIFQFIYNELYIAGNLTFTNISLIKD